MESLLKVTGITKKFQGLVAVDNVSIDMKEHTIHALIGPNGAGKTTTVNLITGVLPLTSGKVEFGGKDITGMTTHDIARQGIGRTFQNIKVFPTMTLLENVMVGGHQQAPMGMMRGIFDIRGSRAEEKRLKEKAEEVLKRIGMYELRGSLMKNLPYGRQKISEIGRAMMNDPKLILLDEPAAGLNPSERAELVDVIYKAYEDGYSFFMIEHNMDVVMKISDYITVLSFGRMIAEGTPKEVQSNEEVIRAYLGSRYVEQEIIGGILMLKVNGIDAYYGDVCALHDISLEIGDDEIISIIGSNGAGKTTLMNCIVGWVKVKKGNVEFNGQDITNLPTHSITRTGVVQIPEGREIFSNMTVLENLEMGSYSIKRSKKEMNAKIEEMYDLFPRLKERMGQKAGSLSGGEQQMLAIARGLMGDPKLLMCDEPSLGLAPVIVDDMFDIFLRINKEKHLPILIVEQNAFMALEVSSRCYVLENGRMVITASSEELAKSDTIKKSYLGG